MSGARRTESNTDLTLKDGAAQVQISTTALGAALMTAGRRATIS